MWILFVFTLGFGRLTDLPKTEPVPLESLSNLQLKGRYCPTLQPVVEGTRYFQKYRERSGKLWCPDF